MNCGAAPAPGTRHAADVPAQVPMRLVRHSTHPATLEHDDDDAERLGCRTPENLSAKLAETR